MGCPAHLRTRSAVSASGRLSGAVPGQTALQLAIPNERADQYIGAPARRQYCWQHPPAGVLLDDSGIFDGVHIFSEHRGMRSSAAQPHFQRSATKLPRAASEVAQRRGALPRPQSACNLGRACTEGAPSRRPLLSPSTEGASSKGVDTIYPLTSRH